MFHIPVPDRPRTDAVEPADMTKALSRTLNNGSLERR